MSDNDAREIAEQAWTLVEANRLAEARVLFLRLCEIDENDAEAWMMLGTLHGESGEIELAVRYLERAIDIDPGYADAYFNLSKIQLKQGQIEQALTSCKSAVEYDPEYAEAWQWLGAIYGQLEDFVEAENCSRKSIDLAPGNSSAYVNLGQSLQNQFKLEEAASCYRNALELDNGLADVWLRLGELSMQLKHFAQAEECYRRASHLKPGAAEVYVHLGMALQIQCKWDEAVMSYRSATVVNSNLFTAYLGLGSVFEKQGLHDDAIINYKHALTLSPNNVQIQYLLGRIDSRFAPNSVPADYVSRLFDEYADRFDTHLVEELGYQVPELIDKAVRTAIGPEKIGLDILDLGCGTGLCGALLCNLKCRLTGVDLSPKMIERARTRKIYDELIVKDVAVALDDIKDKQDLIIAGDVFIYIGDLKRIFNGCKTALKEGGLLAFSIEALPEHSNDQFVLQASGRYAQSTSYIHTLAIDNGLEVVSWDPAVLRKEKGKPMCGYIIVLRRIQ